MTKILYKSLPVDILYKSLPVDMSPHGFKLTTGKWHKIDGEVKICERGFHASENVIDAMGYVPCGVLAKVEVRGKSDVEADKECWSEMRLVKTYKWTKKDSVLLAIFAAELVLENYEKKCPKDLRPRKAIEAAKKVLKDDTEESRSAARSAAESAASAAWSAAESAAWNAAWSAASAAERLSVLRGDMPSIWQMITI